MVEYCNDARCTCVAENRDTICEHEDRTNETFTEQRSLGMYTGYVMKRCEKVGVLRNTCHSLFEHKKVLCDEHEAISKPWYDKACRICGSSHRSCCC